MKKHLRGGRSVVLLLTGGCLLQLAGCLSGLTSVYASYLESSVLRAFFGPLFSP